MKKFLNFLFVCILLIFVVSCDSNRKKPPTAKNGVLDLRGWDFEKDGIIKLDGEWEFYWKQFLMSKDFDTVKKKHLINVPDNWKGYRWNDSVLPGIGYVSYKLKIKLPPPKGILALKIVPLGTAYNFLVNDIVVGNNGKIGKTIYDVVPQFKSQVLELRDYSDSIEIIVWVSNFHYRKGGIWNSVDLGTSSLIQAKRDLSVCIDLLQAGGSLFLSLYLLILFFHRKLEIPALLTGITLIATMIRILSTNEYYIVNIFPNITWNWVIHLEIGSVYFALPLYTAIVYAFFKDEFNKIVFIILQFISYLFVGTVIFLSPYQFSYTVQFMPIPLYVSQLMVIYVCFIAVRHKKTGAKIILIAYIFSVTSAINDILFINNYINTFLSASYSFLLIALCQVYYLSKKSSNEFYQIQNFSNELENTVKERTRELKLEKDKTEKLLETSDRLLLNVLPESIAIRLKAGETQIADHFDEASVVFIDIVDFTKLSAKSTPQKMVKMLNEIFTIFDKIAAKYGLEKIKTIGDCYMAAAGIPIPKSDHAQAIAMMALEVLQTMKEYRSEDNQQIQFRIGLDCGPIVAGVIGEQKFIYDLWGDMVNTASRMETNGVIGKIQCTERFKQKLTSPFPLLAKEGTNDEVVQGWSFHERGEIEIKGKGMMRTWLLESNKGEMQ